VFWITITKKIIISKKRKAHLYVAFSTYTRARLSRLNVCMKERTQRRSNDLEQNTEKRKKLRGSCTYIQPESKSLGRPWFRVPPAKSFQLPLVQSLLHGSAKEDYANETKRSQRSCHEGSCIRMDLRKEDFTTEQKTSLSESCHTEFCFDLSDDDSQLADYQKKTTADVSVMSVSNKPCRKLQRETTIIMIPQSSKSKFCSQTNIPWPQE